MAVYANGPNLGRGAGGVGVLLLTARSRALYAAHGAATAKNTASLTPLIPHFAGMDCGSFFFYGDLAPERTATPMIGSNDALKGLKKPFWGWGGGA